MLTVFDILLFIRFAFWIDALDNIYNGGRPFDHPVIQQLHAVHTAGLINSQQAKQSLYRMVTSRQSISSVTHIETLRQLETYAEHTHTSLLSLALTIIGQSTVDSDHAASHLGCCAGLVNALRATPYLISKNQLLLPQDILTKHGVSQTDVLRAKDNVQEPVFDLASQANNHLEKAKRLMSKLSKSAGCCLLSAAVYERQLEQLRRCHFNLFDPVLRKKNRLLAWQLWRARRKL